VARGHVESLEGDLHKNEEKLRQIVEINEKLKDELAGVRLEKETAQRGLENARSEKNILEAQRKTIAAELDSVLKVKANMATSLTKVGGVGVGGDFFKWKTTPKMFRIFISSWRN